MIKYPNHLLPKSNYKYIRLDAWMNQMFVIRFTEDGNELASQTELVENIHSHFKSSRWFNGISVCLLGPYRKNDVRYQLKRYVVKRFSKTWKQGSRVKPPKNKHLFCADRGYLGIKIADVNAVKFDFDCEYKDGNNKKRRKDTCYLKIEHSPTKSLFWHFNIWLCSKNGITGITFTNEVGIDALPSKNNFGRRADAAVDILRNYVLMPDKLKEIQLPQNYYVNQTIR